MTHLWVGFVALDSLAVAMLPAFGHSMVVMPVASAQSVQVMEVGAELQNIARQAWLYHTVSVLA
jgi:hypothetical protein